MTVGASREIPAYAILRADRRGVSPVIATILLVAITVVLAAVLYFTISAYFNMHNTSANFLGVEIGTSGNGGDWILTVTSVEGALTQNNTALTLYTPNGTVALPTTTLFELERVSGVVVYVPVTYGPTTVSPGDRITLSMTAYPRGCTYTFVAIGHVVASGSLS